MDKNIRYEKHVQLVDILDEIEHQEIRIDECEHDINLVATLNITFANLRNEIEVRERLIRILNGKYDRLLAEIKV